MLNSPISSRVGGVGGHLQSVLFQCLLIVPRHVHPFFSAFRFWFLVFVFAFFFFGLTGRVGGLAGYPHFLPVEQIMGWIGNHCVFVQDAYGWGPVG